MRRNKSKKIVFLLIVVLLLMTIGFASYNQRLDVKEKTEVTTNWNIIISDIKTLNINGHAQNKTEPTYTGLEANFDITFEDVGDYIEYEVMVENNGTVTANLNNIIVNNENTSVVSMTYKGISTGESLLAGSNKIFTVKILYKGGLGSGKVNINLDYGEENKPSTPVIPGETNKRLVYDYSVNGGNRVDIKEKYYINGEDVDLSISAYKDRYDFIGWNINKDATLGLEIFTMPDYETILYAIYKKDLEAIYTKGEGVTLEKEKDVCTLYNNEISCTKILPAANKNGYILNGWYSNSSLTSLIGNSGDEYQLMNDIILYPKWTDGKNKLVYDYITNGGTSADVEEQSYSPGTDVLLSNSAYKDGWVFVGWNTNKEANSGLNNYTMPNSDTILYAIYKKELNVVYTKDEGSVLEREVDSCTLYNNETKCIKVLPMTNKTGYTFNGWYSDSSLTSLVGNIGDSYDLSNNMILYPMWVAEVIPGAKIAFEPSSQSTYISGGKDVILTITDEVGITKGQTLYYAWSTSNTIEPTFDKSLALGNKKTVTSVDVTIPASASSTLTGVYYLWIKSGINNADGVGSLNKISGEFKFDNTAPTLDVSSSKTSKSITLVASASAQSGIEKYEYSIDNGNSWTESNNTYTFNELIHDTPYQALVRVTNGVGQSVTSQMFEITTDLIPTPSFEKKSSDLVTIIFSADCASKYTCSYIKDGGEKVMVTTATKDITFTASGTLIAEITDEKNYTSNVYDFVMVDMVDLNGTSVEVVSSGDGLYKDIYEEGRYVYRGANPNNIVSLKLTSDSAPTNYRIIAKETDGTLKVIQDSSLVQRKFDVSGTTGTETRYQSSGYCKRYLFFYYGCNLWGSNTTTLDRDGVTSLSSGSYQVDGTDSLAFPATEAELNRYLNGEWLTSLVGSDVSKITNHLFDVGPTYNGTNISVNKLKAYEQRYRWNGKIGLLNVSDFAKSTTDSACVTENGTTINASAGTTCHQSNYLFNSSYLPYWTINGSPSVQTDTTKSYTSGMGVYYVNTNGTVGFVNAGDSASVHVRPVFYLDSSVKISGDGTSAQPYVVS